MISYDEAATVVAAAVHREWNSVRKGSDRYMDVTIESVSGAGLPVASDVEGIMR
jgi:hypothetical protein